MDKSEKKVLFRTDIDTKQLLANGKPIEAKEQIKAINEYLRPIKERIEQSYKAIDVQAITKEPITKISEYIKTLETQNIVHLNTLKSLDNRLTNVYEMLNIKEPAKTFKDLTNNYLNTIKEFTSSKSFNAFMNYQSELYGFDKYAKIEISSLGIITTKKELVVTDESLTIDQKLMALNVTAQKFQLYANNNINDEIVRSLAEEIAINMGMIGYTSNTAFNKNPYARAKAFFRHLSASYANTIKEDDSGIYYDTLLEALIRFVNALASFNARYNEYQKFKHKTALQIVTQFDEYCHLMELIKIISRFISKKNRFSIILRQAIIYLISNSTGCNPYNLSAVFYYFLHLQRPKKEHISQTPINEANELLKIISF